MTFKVRNFKYNGFYGENLPGITPYEATFIRWTNDPGVAAFQCSDGKERLIPTFALLGDSGALPPQDFSKKVMFGPASHS